MGPGYGGYGHGAGQIRITDGDSLCFISIVLYNTFGKNIEGVSKKYVVSWIVDDVDLQQ
jgi:hypothetical protein